MKQPAGMSPGEAHPSASDAPLVDAARTAFQARFGRVPRYLAMAPGRVNLIGEHTDYNEGFVLPLAIERQTVVAADWSQRVGSHVCHSVNLNETVEFSVKAEPAGAARHWSNYVRGVFALLSPQRGPQAISTLGLDLLVSSNVPLGGGLSSSAALEVATATLLEAAFQFELPPLQKALLCQRVEHEYAGVPCGIMDQYVSVFGQPGAALLIDCRSLESVPAAIDPNAASVLIVNSNVRHDLGQGAYAALRSQCQQAAALLGVPALRDIDLPTLQRLSPILPPLLSRRARHIVSENQRTVDCANALNRGDWLAVGQLLFASHRSMRDDFEISCDELDLLVRLAEERQSSGLIGARLTGGGFGGSMVALVRPDMAEPLGTELAREYQARTGIAADWFITRPAAGARLLSP